MNVPLRVVLIVFSLLVLALVMRRIRKGGLEISDSLFWLGLSVVLIVVALFPRLVYLVSGFLGFDAPSNFVFFCGFIVLLARSFAQDQKLTTLKKKVIALTQAAALHEHEQNRRNGSH